MNWRVMFSDEFIDVSAETEKEANMKAKVLMIKKILSEEPTCAWPDEKLSDKYNFSSDAVTILKRVEALLDKLECEVY